MGSAVAGEHRLPFAFDGRAGQAVIPGETDIFRNFKGRMRPAERGPGRGNFPGPQRRAVHVVATGLGRRAPADGGPANDQRRLAAAGFGLANRLIDGRRVVAVHRADDLPAVGPEAGRGVVAEPARDMAVDGNPVVVVEADQFVQPPDAGQRADFVADAFHQAAVAEEGPGPVVDHRQAGAVVAAGQQFFRQRHADGVGQPLAQRPGGRLDTVGQADFRVSGCPATHLPEVFQLVDAEPIAAQVQQGIEQHRGMAVGEHETVAVGPGRIDGIVLEVAAPEHFGNIGHAHRSAGMPGSGLFDGIDGQETQGVGELAAGRAGHNGFSHVSLLVFCQARRF